MPHICLSAAVWGRIHWVWAKVALVNNNKNNIAQQKAATLLGLLWFITKGVAGFLIGGLKIFFMTQPAKKIDHLP